MNRYSHTLIMGCWMCLAAWISPLQAQQILFDKGVAAGELNVFPVLNSDTDFRYLSDKVQVAKHPDGSPMFSFIKYVRNTDTEGGSSSITESNEAGGVVHAVVTLEVPEDMRRNAERELQRIRPGAKLVGPIIYKSGTIALISSVAAEDGQLAEKVVGIGSAPILEGQKAAVSVMLTKEGADILWATFQTGTPDLSFQFEMDVAGYLSPKNVTIEANFDQIYRHRSFEAAAVTPVFAAEIKTAFDELANSGAIKVTQIGEDAALDAMRETAYNQLVNLMFDKVGGQGLETFAQLANSQNQTSMVDRATNMLTAARTEARAENKRLRDEAAAKAERERQHRQQAARLMDSLYRARGLQYSELSPDSQDSEEDEVEQVPIPGIAIAASFVMKTVKRSGSYKIDLNKYTEDTRTFPFADNVGTTLNSCESCFARVNLDDDLYKQRELSASLQDINSDDFGSYVSNVEVVLRKQHQGGDVTLADLVINQSRFNDFGNSFELSYGWKQDVNRSEWLTYDYKTRWNFSGGVSVETDWQTGDFGSIPLYPPLKKQTVFVDVDPFLVSDQNVRAVEVKLYYKHGERELSKTVQIRTAGNILSQSVDLIQPDGTESFDYQITWFVSGSAPIRESRKTYDASTLYLFEIDRG
ncbi:hypothetical protein [Pontibacter sp. G13]|uniref:hypothetical protein n=1 Tax=Pontibacter sp. G13 TaxID=3074898 RepID=UPI00288ACECB|nr:hypothetical protein [Pontibacter sp. G13]WNJ19649.1 hypothetical protein RJD25_04115 [Pontibacter sp. G13]